MDCIFCKIIKGEIPSYKVYEDDKILVFLDIAPVNPGHVLIIPKGHYSNLEEVPEDILLSITKVVKKVGQALKAGFGAPGYNVNINNDPIAGQLIPHLHVHLIPRRENDGLELWPQHEYKEGEAGKVAEKIISSL